MDFLNWVPTIIAGLGIWVAVVQLRGAKLESFADRRPYVVCKYRVSVVPGKPDGVYLDISNVGETPAGDIKLEFDTGVVWNWVNSSAFPFSTDGPGISVLAPNETISFYVGNLTPRSALQELRNTSIVVRLEYKAHGPSKRKKLLHDQARLTLMDYKYQSKK